jgi:hypothetical protein
LRDGGVAIEHSPVDSYHPTIARLLEQNMVRWDIALCVGLVSLTGAACGDGDGGIAQSGSPAGANVSSAQSTTTILVGTTLIGPQENAANAVSLDGAHRRVGVRLPEGYEVLEAPEDRTLPGTTATLTSQTFLRRGVGTLTLSILTVEESEVAALFDGLDHTTVALRGRTFYQRTASEIDGSHMVAFWSDGVLVSLSGSGTRPEDLLDVLSSATVEDVG